MRETFFNRSGSICVSSAMLIAAAASEAEAQSSGELVADPIVVTGERVERSTYETASSVTVVTGEQIESDPSTKEVEDIYYLIPNLTQTGTSGNGVAIRGIDTSGPLLGADAFLGGSRPRTTITIDGRPLNYFEYTNGTNSVWDVERVEVFLGPQTTSQGVNSIAGATHIVTADPTFEPEFKGQAEIGNFNNRRVALAASGPLIADELAVRFAADYQLRDSFVEGFGPLQGFDEDEFENMTLRGKVLWEPKALPELSTKLTFSYYMSQEPQVEFVVPPFDNPRAGLAEIPGFESRVFSVGHDISFDLTDNLTLSNRLIYADVANERFSAAGQGNGTIEQSEITEELNLTFSALDGKLTGIVGASVFLSDVDDSIDLSGFLGISASTDKRTSLGFFGEATYALTDKLDITAGLRYQRDTQDRLGSIGPFSIDFDESFDAFLPKFAVGYDVSDNLRVGATVSRGFNPGGATISFATGGTDFFDEETVWNYELFARTRLLEDRLELNANLFFSDYRDFQTSAITGFVGGNVLTEISNADRARSYGLELSARYQPFEELDLFGSIGLLDTKITEFSSSIDPFVVGNQFPRAPHATLTFGANYEVIDNLTLGTRARFSSGYFSDFDNSDTLSIGSNAFVDFSLTYAYENVEAYAYVDNAFNNDDAISQVNFGAILATIQTPREFGAGLRVRF